ncbi:type VII toxin-antitoxin system HepT family RNase toxin [Actinomycetospora atypica]|uniref:DUF86 domain-containing protein n=1 Tax=Actinomycetospora atypica TaxID=1290095 RepID=A0ABV9YI54_9PSEU
MVDEVRVERLLRSLSSDLAYLRAEAIAGPERRADPAWLRAVKYTFVTGIEAAVDVAQHFCAAEGWGPLSNNGDALRVLGRHGVLEPDLAARLAAAVGFRNVLVHEYVDVDDGIVVDRLADLSDLDDFVSAIASWLRQL